jgi:hypothetical protein
MESKVPVMVGDASVSPSIWLHSPSCYCTALTHFTVKRNNYHYIRGAMISQGSGLRRPKANLSKLEERRLIALSQKREGQLL